MRGVVVFVTGLFMISGITMFAGMLLEPFIAIVGNDEAVQALGWGDTPADIGDTILRWMPLLFIAYLLVWAGVWYFRFERFTEVRRR